MKLAILDRDGVINHDSDSYIKSPEEWKPIKGSLEAIVRLNRSGYVVVVATNQSGIARGLFDTRRLQQIHKKMVDAIVHQGGRLDAIFYCPHADADHCACRKPKEALFLDALRRFNVTPRNAIAIGDSLRDLQAAISAGISHPSLVLTGKGHSVQNDPKLPPHTPIYADLAMAVDAILVHDEEG